MRHKRSNAEEQLHACRGLNGEMADLKFAVFYFTGKPKAYKPWGFGGKVPVSQVFTVISTYASFFSVKSVKQGIAGGFFTFSGYLPVVINS